MRQIEVKHLGGCPRKNDSNPSSVERSARRQCFQNLSRLAMDRQPFTLTQEQRCRYLIVARSFSSVAAELRPTSTALRRLFSTHTALFDRKPKLEFTLFGGNRIQLRDFAVEELPR